MFMVTPNTADDRAKLIASKTTGFIYTVSLLGVTGSRDQLSVSVGAMVEKLKAIADVPVCVGFGISKTEHAIAVAQAGADGVIIGSKIEMVTPEKLEQEAKKLEEIIEGWKSSWQEKDIEEYISFYHNDFRSGGKNRHQWKRYKSLLNNVMLHTKHLKLVQVLSILLILVL